MAIIRKVGLIQLAIVLLMVSGCSGVRVRSNVIDGKIFVNDKDTGLTTPARLKFGYHLQDGQHSIHVEAPGFVPSDQQLVTVFFGPGRVVWSVVLPVPMLFINLIRGFTLAKPNRLDFSLSRVAQTGN